MDVAGIDNLLAQKMTRRRMVIAGVTGLGLAAAHFWPIKGLEAAPVVSVIYGSRIPGLRPPAGAFDIIQLIQDFAPGAYLGSHTHDGPVFGLILSGEMTLRLSSRTQTYLSGASAECGPGVHSPGNDVQNQWMRRLLTGLIPAGIPFSRPAEGVAPAATGQNAFPASRVSVTAPLPEFDLVQELIELDSGVMTNPYFLQDPNVWTVVEGDARLETRGSSRTVARGEQFSLQAGESSVFGNVGFGPIRLALSALLAPGMALPALTSRNG